MGTGREPIIGPKRDRYEFARRLRAVIAYRGMSREEAARILDISVPSLQRYVARTGEPPPRGRIDSEKLWELADACGMPREWFSADLGLLHLTVVDGPTFTPREDPREQLVRELEERAAEGRLSPPSDEVDSP